MIGYYMINDERGADVAEWVNGGKVKSSLYPGRSDVKFIVGGDGFLMKCIHVFWQYGLPFVGINRGTKGFMLNDIKTPEDIPTSMNDLNFVDLTLMQGEFITERGEVKTYLAFNDIFCGGNIADYITFTIQGELSYFPNRVVTGNGVVVSTAQGTTGFALKARNTSALLPLDSKNWFIGGVATGPYPCDQVNQQKITIDVASRKPVHAYADGYNQEIRNVKRIIISPTNHSIKLGFLKNTDFAARRTLLAQKVERGE